MFKKYSRIILDQIKDFNAIYTAKQWISQIMEMITTILTWYNEQSIVGIICLLICLATFFYNFYSNKQDKLKNRKNLLAKEATATVPEKSIAVIELPEFTPLNKITRDFYSKNTNAEWAKWLRKNEWSEPGIIITP